MPSFQFEGIVTYLPTSIYGFFVGKTVPISFIFAFKAE